MSSIRIFILGALADRGPMHGHQLVLLANKEHISEWADITVGSLYGAIKRLAGTRVGCTRSSTPFATLLVIPSNLIR